MHSLKRSIIIASLTLCILAHNRPTHAMVPGDTAAAFVGASILTTTTLSYFTLKFCINRLNNYRKACEYYIPYLSLMPAQQ